MIDANRVQRRGYGSSWLAGHGRDGHGRLPVDAISTAADHDPLRGPRHAGGHHQRPIRRAADYRITHIPPATDDGDIAPLSAFSAQWLPLCETVEHGMLGVPARFSGVEVWRGGDRPGGLLLAGGFRPNAGVPVRSMAPFPHPAHRTGRAVFPHLMSATT